MDIQAYIASGQLEAYALGLLPPAEAAQVAADVALHPLLTEELARVETDIEYIANATALTTPSTLAPDIWNRLAADVPVQQAPATPTATLALQRKPRLALQQAAIWLLLTGSLLLNAWLWYQQKDQAKLRDENMASLAQLRQQQADLQEQINQFRQRSQTIFSVGSQLIPLQSMAGGQTYVLVYNTNQQLALFDMSRLPPPPDGKQYQMWVIVDGKPHSMGVIPIQKPENGMLEMHQPAQPGQQAFAISLEQQGGSPSPTEVLMLGKVQG